jgi:digeranylgeranylglycerophospholipid reductase
MKYDTAVVGNGPAGCIAARHAARDGELALVGGGARRVQCAGLISKSGMRQINVKPGEFVLNRVRGARIYSPCGLEVEVDGGSTKAYAVDRLGFDRHLLEQACDAGATYIDDWVSRLNGTLCLRYSGDLKADNVILATGTDYTLQKKCGIDCPTEFLIGGQYEMEVECDPDFVELYFTVPDFFAWVIPLDDRARVGLAVKSNPRPYLESFVDKLRSRGRLKSQRKLSESFGVIPVYKPSLRTQYDGVVTVGDAAGQVKASTGGGIVFGGICSQYAVRADYERQWRDRVGRELKLHLMIHRMLARLSDKGKDRLLSAVRDSQDTLSQRGDMDIASTTVSTLLRDPRFLAKTLANLPWLLAGFI